MYVWELVSFRLRQEGWDVRHSLRTDNSGPLYNVVLRRPGSTREVSVCGPTLTEAFAVAARQCEKSTDRPT